LQDMSRHKLIDKYALSRLSFKVLGIIYICSAFTRDFFCSNTYLT